MLSKKQYKKSFNVKYLYFLLNDKNTLKSLVKGPGVQKNLSVIEY